MSPRILIHAQHLLGTGHLRRAAALARALADRGAEVELLSGGPPIAHLSAGAARLVQLPPVRAADATFKTLLDAEARPIDDRFRADRRARVLGALEAQRPHAVVTELFPFGRRGLAFELVPLIETARAMRPRPLIVASLRDVLVAPSDPQRRAEALARAEQWYDHLMVHGDAALIALEASYPGVERLGPKLDYSGYVAGSPTAEPPGREGEGEIVVSIGGGAVGARLIESAIGARAQLAAASAPLGRCAWRLLLGGQLPATAADRLSGMARQGMIIEPARPDFPRLIARARVSVSQAGYNTVIDILAASARAVLVPFAAEGENEQTLRAEALARRGWADVVSEAGLTPAALAAAIMRADRRPRPETSAIKIDGARVSAGLMLGWLAERQAGAA